MHTFKNCTTAKNIKEMKVTELSYSPKIEILIRIDRDTSID